jgi:hypothetical protein
MMCDPACDVLESGANPTDGMRGSCGVGALFRFCGYTSQVVKLGRESSMDRTIRSAGAQG